MTTYDQVLSEVVWFLVGVAVVYAVGQLVVVPLVARVVRARNANNPTIESAAKTYLRVLLVSVAILAGLVAAGYGSVLSDSTVVIAAITFVLGIAGQQVFGSLISGRFLVADPDFDVGDWIEWPGGQGTIEAVDFRVARVRTPDNEIVSVPNTELTSNALTRPYGRDRYRITEQVFVDYDEDTERALMQLQQVAVDHDAVLDEPAPDALVADLGENAIALEAAFWIDDPTDTDIVGVRSDFRRRVKRRFDEAGITLAPPSGQLLSGEVAVTERTDESGTSSGS